MKIIIVILFSSCILSCTRDLDLRQNASFNFNNSTIDEVLRNVSTQYNVEIQLNKKLVTESTPSITLKVDDIPLIDGLDFIAQLAGLELYVYNGIVEFAAASDVAYYKEYYIGRIADNFQNEDQDILIELFPHLISGNWTEPNHSINIRDDYLCISNTKKIHVFTVNLLAEMHTVSLKDILNGGTLPASDKY